MLFPPNSFLPSFILVCSTSSSRTYGLVLKNSAVGSLNQSSFFSIREPVRTRDRLFVLFIYTRLSLIHFIVILACYLLRATQCFSHTSRLAPSRRNAETLSENRAR